jgi:hypothetical protein
MVAMTKLSRHTLQQLGLTLRSKLADSLSCPLPPEMLKLIEELRRA